MRAVVIVLLVSSLIGTSSVLASKLDQGSPILSEDDLRAKTIELLKGNKQWTLDVAEAAEALSDELPAISGLCDWIKGDLTSEKLTSAAAYAGAKFRCFGKEDATRAQKQIWGLLKAEATVEEHAAALRASSALQDLKAPKTGQEELARLGKLLSDVTASSGKVRSQRGVPVSIRATGEAYKIASVLPAGGPGEAEIALLKAQAPKVWEQAAQGDWVAAGDNDGLLAVTSLLEGLRSIGVTPELDEKVAHLVQLVGKQFPIGSLREAVLLLRISKVLSAWKAPVVQFQAAQPRLVKGKEIEIGVLAKGPGGKLVEVTGLVAYVIDVSGARIATAAKLTGSGGKYTLDISQIPLEKGQILLDLKGTAGSGGAVSGRLTVVVTAPASFDSVTLSLEEEDGSELFSRAATPSQLLSPPQVPATATLKVSTAYDKSSSPPILRLVCKGSNEAAVLGFEKSGAELVTKQSLATILALLESRMFPGEPQEVRDYCWKYWKTCPRPVAIFIWCPEVSATIEHADPHTDPLKWHIADIKLRGAPEPQPPSAPGPRPIIEHLFRTPDRRPARVVSLFFAVAAILPLGFLVFGLLQLKVNLQEFPTKGQGVIAAAVFHLALLGLVGLYSAFWLRLNLLETLGPLFGLAPVLAVSGYLLLSHLSELRLKRS